MGVNDSHPRYDLCRDRDCDRYGCIAYHEGREDGYQDGYEDGLAACQRTHDDKE
jgi:hypothetical protein